MKSLPESQAQSDSEGSEGEEEDIWFPAKKVLQKSTSIVWNFFQFKGTKEKGPNKTRVFCRQ